MPAVSFCEGTPLLVTGSLASHVWLRTSPLDPTRGMTLDSSCCNVFMASGETTLDAVNVPNGAVDNWVVVLSSDTDILPLISCFDESWVALSLRFSLAVLWSPCSVMRDCLMTSFDLASAGCSSGHSTVVTVALWDANSCRACGTSNSSDMTGEAGVDCLMWHGGDVWGREAWEWTDGVARSGVGVAGSWVGVARSEWGVAGSWVGVARSGWGVAGSWVGVARSWGGVVGSWVGVAMSEGGVAGSWVGVARSWVGVARSGGGVAGSLVGVARSGGGVAGSWVGVARSGGGVSRSGGAVTGYNGNNQGQTSGYALMLTSMAQCWRTRLTGYMQGLW